MGKHGSGREDGYKTENSQEYWGGNAKDKGGSCGIVIKHGCFVFCKIARLPAKWSGCRLKPKDVNCCFGRRMYH